MRYVCTNDCVLLIGCSVGMYTELATASVRKLYISETHNKHAGPYTCVELRQHQTLAHRTVTLLLYSKNSSLLRLDSVHTSPMTSLDRILTRTLREFRPLPR